VPIALCVFAFGFGVLLSVKGADFLVTACVRMRDKTGIGEITVGATLVSVITTLPEFFVAVISSGVGEPEIAVGASVGSVIFNMSAVLSVYLLAAPVTVCRKEIWRKSVLLYAVLAVLMLFSLNGNLSLPESLCLIGLLAVFAVFGRGEIMRPEIAPERPVRSVPVWPPFSAGIAMLLAGSFLIVSYGEEIAALLYMPKNVMATLFVASGISFPELFIAVSAVTKKHSGIALGNIIGSCILNCTLLLGAAGVISAVTGRGLPISHGTLLLSIPFMFIMTAVAIVPILIRQKTNRLFGILLLAGYAVYIWLLCG
jgi:cation:H+ antiporter